MHFALYAVALILLIPSVGLVFIPAFPAIFMMLLITTGFGFVDNFVHLTPANLAVLAGIFVLSFIVDQLSGILGAKYGGASRKGILYGFIGLIVGTILFPPLGGLIGLFLGVGVSEYYVHKNQQRAIKAASGSLLGALAGIVTNVVLACIFVILFAIFAFA